MGLWHMILQLRKRALTNPAITVVFCMGVVGHGVPPFGSPKGWNPSPSVFIPALRTVGNICIIEHGALPCLLSLLANNHKKKHQIRSLLDNLKHHGWKQITNLVCNRSWVNHSPGPSP
ncbi:putative armadillo-like helical protein [Helianthus annuus]|uniref:Armadillo-like helical protein n=2 Tax=Helianthus annuus TaxID=4232 RepID=A0A9K3HVH6_HELAN|nr:putative armadillo-like helical protein [Helianthus annuus]KAJ0512857.1 putative armadillo-like helical protein [Helianthus annuus]KAJ0695896.1 putative armadillo-like helical protein [Helianthus annuus]